MSNIFKWTITIAFLVFAICVVFLRVVFPPKYVETGSMEPEYQVGALVWVNTEAYTKIKPKEGDVAVYALDGREVMHRIERVNPDGTYTCELLGN